MKMTKNIFEESIKFVSQIFTLPEERFRKLRIDINNYIYNVLNIELDTDEKNTIFSIFEHLDNKMIHLVVSDSIEDINYSDHFDMKGNIESIITFPMSHILTTTNNETIFNSLVRVYKDIISDFIYNKSNDNNIYNDIIFYTPLVLAAETMVNCNICNYKDISSIDNNIDWKSISSYTVEDLLIDGAIIKFKID